MVFNIMWNGIHHFLPLLAHHSHTSTHTGIRKQKHWYGGKIVKAYMPPLVLHMHKCFSVNWYCNSIASATLLHYLQCISINCHSYIVCTKCYIMLFGIDPYMNVLWILVGIYKFILKWITLEYMHEMPI